MINLDKIVNNNNEEHNEKCPYIPDHRYRILMIGGSRSGKTSALLHLINEQKDIDKINNRRELQNIATNHSADIDYQAFMKIYRECIKKPYSFLIIDTTLPSSNPLRF